MLISDILTFIRNKLGEPTAAFWSDVELTVDINSAAKEVYAEVLQSVKGFFETSTTISTVVGTETYQLPTGCWKINLIERTDMNPPVNLMPIDIVEKNRFYRDSIGYASGYERYWISGNYIGIAPIPDSVVTYKIWYVPTLANMTSGQTLPAEFTDLHHEVICWGALLRATMKDRELYKMWEPNFLRLWALLKADCQNRQLQEPKQIIDSDIDY